MAIKLPLSSRLGSRLPVLLITVLFAIGLLSGCVGIVRPGQSQQTTWLSIPPGDTLGQTFLSKYDSLSGMQLNLRAPESATGELVLRLYRRDGDNQPVAESTLEISESEELGARSFTFSALPDSDQQDYRMELTFNGQGGLEVAATGGEAYLYGAAYRNGTPLENQLAFGLTYWTPYLLLGLAWESLRWLGYLLAAGALFILPGWALMDLLWARWREWDWTVRLGVSGSVGLALYPVLFLWSDWFSLKPGPLLAWLTPLLALGALVWRYRGGLAQGSGDLSTAGWHNGSRNGQGKSTPAFLAAFLIVLAASAVGRFWVVRNLDVPMWGDSVQHTVMAQLMLDNGGLFSSWLPYTPYSSLTTHYGFSAAVAVFAWFTGLPVEAATLFTGQALNLMAVLAILPLAFWAARGNRWAGLGAVLAAGLLMAIPGVFVNWGRYAQLAGQVVLPGLMWMTVISLDNSRIAWRNVFGIAVLGGIVLAGMGLSYYRAPIYYAAFVAAWLVFWVLLPRNRSWRTYRRALVSLGALGILGALVLLPWLPRLLGSNLGAAVAAGVEQGMPSETLLADFSNWSTLPEYIPWWCLGIALAGFVWGLVRRNWEAVSLALWVGLMAAYYLGGLVGLPAANMLQTFAIVILMYVPVGVLSGYLFGELATWFRRAWPGGGEAAAGLVVVGLALWGGLRQATLGEPYTYALFTRPDRIAMHWIEDNTPQESVFLVEGFTIYDGTSAVGSDGGWWLPLIGKRLNSMPPQYALFNEQPIQPGYSAWVTDLVSLLENQSISDPQALSALCRAGITHVYIGQRQGEVGSGVRQLVAPQQLLDQPAYDLIYHQDRVYIFEIDQRACPGTP